MWRNLVSQFVQDTQANRLKNPGVEAIGKLVEESAKIRNFKDQSAIEEAQKGRLAAKEATYKNYPQLAAQESGLTVTPEMEAARVAGEALTPTWNQEQEVQSLKDGILRGHYTYSKGWSGEAESKPIKTVQDALSIIHYKSLDPSLFVNELTQLREKYITTVPDKEVDQMLPKIIQSLDKEKGAKLKKMWKGFSKDQKIELLEAHGII